MQTTQVESFTGGRERRELKREEEEKEVGERRCRHDPVGIERERWAEPTFKAGLAHEQMGYIG